MKITETSGMADGETNITRLLSRMRDGDAVASEAIIPVLYEELRAIAARCLRSERRGHTLQPTALVHEAYLKLVDQKDADYRSRGHFMAVAAMVMRRILVTHAEKRSAAKRGGGAERIPFDEALAASGERSVDLVALDEALNKLARRDPRKAKVVEQRFFDGMEMSQIAENLGVSLSTVKRDWVCGENRQAVPKVIDFGVAKATNQRLTEQTLFTEHGVLIGTPEYMSPEQAGSNGSDIDTRSDIYSLGVLLYELLVGALPIDTETLRKASLDELHRLIRDQDPPKPTTRLSSLGADAVNRARNRGTDVTNPRRTLSGDLDWIVMKCLEKDPDRRYAATAELIDDLECYLHHRPLSAGPPTVRYRMRKFARRNRGFIAAASIVFVVLAAGIVSTITYALAESRQRAVAETQVEIASAVNEFLDDMLASVDP